MVTRSEHIPRIQEAQASAYHVLRELVELTPESVTAACRRSRPAPAACAPAWRARCRAWAFVPTSTAWPRELGLSGYVLNDARGVVVEVEADAAAVESFLERLAAEAPPLAAVERVTAEELPATRRRRLRDRGEPALAGSPARPCPPDSATCDDCLAELFDPLDRRHRYPFINCTNCGPRFTIVRGVPYDRPFTTMAGFAMCAACRAEYEDPADRRFHAQPNACPGLRAARAGWRGRTATSRIRDRRGGGRAARGRHRRREGARRLPPRLPRRTTRTRWRGCARASTARTSRSR